MSYLDSLPKGISLQVFSNDELIFSSSGKWLNPLFELENFFKNNSISKETNDVVKYGLYKENLAEGLKTTAEINSHAGARCFPRYIHIAENNADMMVIWISAYMTAPA